MNQPDDTERQSPRSRFSDVDPADIDRYLSGRSTKSKDQAAKPKPRLSTTARQLEQLQQQVANSSRSRRPESTPDASPEDASDTVTRPSAASLAARSSYRTNRRASYMREDPYVDAVDDVETDDPAVSQSPQPTYTGRRRPARAEHVSTGSSFPSTRDDASEEYGEERQQPGQARQPRSRPTMPRPEFSRPTMPRVIANADVANDIPALIFIAVSTLGLAAMAILVANRMASLDEVIPTHVSASGVFERFASRETIWQLPLLATMLTLMNIVAAWFVSPLDRFASRFLLATGVVVQFVAWVALIRLMY